MKLTPAQIYMMIMSVAAFIVGATGQLTDLFGANVAHTIVTAVGFASGLFGAIITPFIGQAAQIKAVSAMAKDPTSPVQGVVVTSTPEGRAIAASAPGQVAIAGSPAATELIKP